MANQTYNMGEAVTEEGDYVCVPCGYHKHFKSGDVFPECTSCLAGTDAGHEDYIEGIELWEKLEPKKEESEVPAEN